MGRLEKELKSEIRRTKINKAIITTLVVAGAVALGAVPVRVTDLLMPRKHLHQRRYQAKTALLRMLQKGIVKMETTARGRFVRLTSKGERLAALMGEGRLLPKKPKRWDGKWRMLIFDIPERRRPLRAKVRATLRELGFVRLQDSVWVFPYDCEDLIVILKADFRIGKDLLYIIADKVENDGALRAKFNLTG